MAQTLPFPQAENRQRRQLRHTRLRNLLPAAPFVLPGLVLACVFVIYPMLFNVYISFTHYDIVGRAMTWVGLENYKTLFAESQGRLFLAIRNNFLYAVITTPFILFFGLLFAVLINNLRRARMAFRTFFYLPVITSWVIVGMVFAYMFNPGQRGLINYVLVDVLHLTDDYVPWLQKTWTGNLVIWIMGVWKNVGWSMVIYLAGLQGISSELYEAAGMEGAGPVAKFRYITVPLLKDTTFYVMVNMLIGAFNVFLQVLILTSGNPRGTTSVLQYLLYDRAFNLFEFGQGAAIGLMTAMMVLFTTLVLNRLFRTEGGKV